MGGHPVAGAPVHHDGLFGAEAPGGAGGVHGGVAAAVDHDAAAQQRLVLALHVAQQGDGVQDVRRLPRRDVGAAADVRADGQEHRIESSLGLGGHEVVHTGVQFQFHAHGQYPVDLGVQHVAGQPVRRDPEAHHAAGLGTRLADHDVVAHSAQVIGGRQARRTSADDQHPLAGGGRRGGQRPAGLQRRVAQEPFHGVDPHRLVEFRTVAGGLTGVVADPAHDRGERVVRHQDLPGLLVTTVLGFVQPALDVLPCRAGVVAWGQRVSVQRPLGAPRTRLVGQAGSDFQRDREGLLGHTGTSSMP